jgi:protocatechuate 3,4-dioxygenase beta subunit
MSQEDHDDKIVGTILTRREALRAAAIAGFSLALGAAGQGAMVPSPRQKAMHLIATPEVEEGPFFIDEGLHRINLVEGTSRKTVALGSPLGLRFTLYALRSKSSEPLAGAHVDIWHADAGGNYSDEAPGPIQQEDTKGQKWLRGYQITDANGKARFETIYPGWYHNRTPHIHVKIRNFDAKTNKSRVFNTQLFFDDETNDVMYSRPPYDGRGVRRVRNLWDGDYAIRQADGTTLGSHLHFDVTKSSDGIAKVAEFVIGLKLA